MSRRTCAALILLLVCGVFAGLAAARRRFHVEMSNRRVEIGIEYAEADSLSRFSGIPLSSILQRFKSQGVRALILTEDTPANLETTGAVHPIREPLIGGRASTLVEVDGSSLLSRIGTALRDRGVKIQVFPSANSLPLPSPGSTRFIVHPDLNPHAPALEASLDYSHLRTLGIGLPPEGVLKAKRAGLKIAARISNFPNVIPETAQAVLENLHSQGADLVIFNGDEVLGYRGQEKQVANLFRSSSLPRYGDIEFGKQKGEGTIEAALHGDYVRVHSIQQAEMGQMSEAAMIERYSLAARERNIRFCYVRLLTAAGPDPLAVNALFLQKIAHNIEKGTALDGGGLAFGTARPFHNTGVTKWMFALLGLGTGAGIFWALSLFMPIPEKQGLPLLIFFTLGSLLLSLAGEEGRRLAALAAGIAFPTAACLFTLPLPDRGDPFLSPFASLTAAGKKLLLASSITLIGIIHVVGLLATRPFMVKTVQFLGIKAQHGLPILIVALAVMSGGAAQSGENWNQWKLRIRSHLQRVINEPVRYGILLLLIISLLLIALMLARTGNDSGIGVSVLELKIRALLDRILPTRPRTKEFLLGHPAFLLAFAFWMRGRRRLAVPLFVAGSIGQVSILNTFCHIHTPLIVSAWRGGLGLVIGAAIGAGVFLIIERILPAPTPLHSDANANPSQRIEISASAGG